MWGVERWDPDGVVVRVVVKTAPLQQWTVAREMRERIKDRFDAEGIEIPLPQRVVWHRRLRRPDATGRRSRRLTRIGVRQLALQGRVERDRRPP